MVATPLAVGLERSRRRFRGFLGNFLLAAASSSLVAVAIVATECLVRRLAPAYLVETRGIHVFSSVYGWIGRPDAVASMGTGRVTLNRLGFRGRELPPRREGGPTRVLVLGDSIAFGFGVADEQTFTHLLDARDNGIAAANMAVQGFGPGQELLVLQREGLRADPDVVVLAVCLRNDLADAVLPVALYNGVNPRPRYRLAGDELVLDDAGVRLSAPARAVGWLSDHSHLYNRLSALLAARPEPSEDSWRVRKQEALRDSDYALRLSVKLVLEMQRLCRVRGVVLLVATFPGEHGYESEPELHRRFHAALRNAGVRTLALRDELRARGLGASEVTLDETGHLAPAGHRATADVLESEILRLAGARLSSSATGSSAFGSCTCAAAARSRWLLLRRSAQDLELAEQRQDLVPTEHLKGYHVDPLVCLRCGQTMSILAFVSDQHSISRILEHLGLRSPELDRGPPAREILRVVEQGEGWARGQLGLRRDRPRCRWSLPAVA